MWGVECLSEVNNSGWMGSNAVGQVLLYFDFCCNYQLFDLSNYILIERDLQISVLLK